MSPMSASRRLTTVLTATLAGALLLTACSSGDPGPGNGSGTESSVGTDSAAGAEGAGAVHDIPGTSLTITTPDGWEQATQEGTFFVRSNDDAGTGFRSNVVVTVENAGTAVLEEQGRATSDYLDGTEGWSTDAEGQGPTTLGDLEAYRLSGSYELDGVEVAQSVLIVDVEDPATDRLLVTLTASHAVTDTTGTQQAARIVESLAPAED